MEELSSNIFNSVFVHRFKDSHDHVRALCVRRLGDWLTADPARLFKDEYVKYAGWATFDHNGAVRRQAVRSLAKLLHVDGDDDDEQAKSLASFFMRFLERMIEVAVGDIDPAIALDMLRVLRRMQTLGMLNEMPDDLLDRIDEVIFDADAALEVRPDVLSRPRSRSYVGPI